MNTRSSLPSHPFISLATPIDRARWESFTIPQRTTTPIVRVSADVLQEARRIRLMEEAKADYLEALRLHTDGNVTMPADQVDVRARDVVRLSAALLARPSDADIDEMARRDGDRDARLFGARHVNPHGD